uniref:Death effector domain containing 2 n=1 Tax=Apteryx owenii TaxID=8824 RepID=A0A8B9P5H1_APTOW
MQPPPRDGGRSPSALPSAGTGGTGRTGPGAEQELGELGLEQSRNWGNWENWAWSRAGTGRTGRTGPGAEQGPGELGLEQSRDQGNWAQHGAEQELGELGPARSRHWENWARGDPRPRPQQAAPSSGSSAEAPRLPAPLPRSLTPPFLSVSPLSLSVPLFPLPPPLPDIRLRVRAEYCEHEAALRQNVASNRAQRLARQLDLFGQASTVLKSRDLGSIICDIKFSELSYLDAFWSDYLNGSLLEALKGVFLTDSLKEAVGREAIRLLVNVDEDDYEEGRRLLLDALGAP